jgi:hypothetical protein
MHDAEALERFQFTIKLTAITSALHVFSTVGLKNTQSIIESESSRQKASRTP